jgi:hypothetical protein
MLCNLVCLLCSSDVQKPWLVVLYLIMSLIFISNCLVAEGLYQKGLTFYLVALQALRLLAAMEESRGKVAPDTVSYNTVLKVCGKAQRINQAMKVNLCVCKRGLGPQKLTSRD